MNNLSNKPSNGGNQLWLTSQCASRNTKTLHWDSFAPIIRAFIAPWRSSSRITLTIGGNSFCSMVNFTNLLAKFSVVLASSTRIISVRSLAGERRIMV